MRSVVLLSLAMAVCFGCSGQPEASDESGDTLASVDEPLVDTNADEILRCPGVLPHTCQVCADGQTHCAHFDPACKIVVCEDAIQACGGTNGPCGGAEYCGFRAGNACGWTGDTGVCRPRPFACPNVYLPVCGCNHVTYSNSCKAHQQGVSIAYRGEC